jgi:hypothetical protein
MAGSDCASAVYSYTNNSGCFVERALQIYIKSAAIISRVTVFLLTKLIGEIFIMVLLFSVSVGHGYCR